MGQRDGSAILDPREQAARAEAAQARGAVDAQFKKYMAEAEGLRKAALTLNIPDVAEDMTKLLLRLKEGPVRLLVLGTSCAGKSTLVNALAGIIVSPEGDWVTSCVPLWVKGVEPNAPKRFYSYRENQSELYGLKREREKRPDILSLFCHAPNGQDSPKVEGCVGLGARVPGGYLWRTGLSLVDTPGFHSVTDESVKDAEKADASQANAVAASREEDTRRALDAIGMGAELLVILHRKTATEEDVDFLRSLFPGKENDLSLDMYDDVFLIGNNDPGKKGTRTGFQKQLMDMVSPAKPRFYFINVLKQRRQVEYYQYDEWFPGGMRSKDIERQNKDTKAEKKSFDLVADMRVKLGKEVGYIGQDLVEAVADAECERDAQEAYDAHLAAGEREDEALAAMRQILDGKTWNRENAVADWEAMEKLKSDLAERAEEIYADPVEKIYQPIEVRLGAAAGRLAEECRRRMKRIEDQRKSAADGIDRDFFYSETLDALRKERFQLIDLRNRVLAAKARCDDLLQKAEESVALLTGDNWIDKVIGKALLESYGHTAALQQFDMGGGNETFTRSGTWYEHIVEPCVERSTEKRREAVDALEDKLRQLDTQAEIPYTEDGEMKTGDNPVKLIREMFDLCNAAVGEVSARVPGLRERLKKPADGWYQELISTIMARVKANAHKTSNTWQMAVEMSEALQKRQEGLNRKGFGQRLTNIFLEPNTSMIVNSAMTNTLDEAIKGDLKIVTESALDYWNKSARPGVEDAVSILDRLRKALTRRIQEKEKRSNEEVRRLRDEYYKDSVASDRSHIEWTAQRQNWLALAAQYRHETDEDPDE